MKVTAKAIRSGSWWAVEIPEVEGAYTQTRRLDQIPAMAAEVVALLDEKIDTADVEVEVIAQTSADDADLIKTVVSQGREANLAMASYAIESRRAVAELVRRGYTVRDIGRLLGISASRVSQLSAASRH